VAALPELDWSKLFDNPANATPGWSFLNDKRSSFPVVGSDYLLRRLQHDPDRRARFWNSHLVWRPNAVHGYLRLVESFRANLAVLTQLSWGQPARGTELLSIQHRNGDNGSGRGVFIEDGLVVLVTRYHKGYNATGTLKTVHRYLPREVGRLLVYFL